MSFRIQGREIGFSDPTYFIADIGANHDGSLERAKRLIRLAKEAGADAAKFQHFDAAQIVSRKGFEDLGAKVSHQASWSKTVFDVYQDASLPRSWTSELKNECDRAGIHFFSSPYDQEAVEHLNEFTPAFKIGSGDINWDEMLCWVANKRKPVILATGASGLAEVTHAVEVIQSFGVPLAILQCNTNYTGETSNLDHLNLRVLETYQKLWPDVVVGLSDHCRSTVPVIAAVALGARIVERHFTDDCRREGPDHSFALDPHGWAEMVSACRDVERVLGDGVKRVEANELEAAVVQRRAVRAAATLPVGHVLQRSDLVALRPAPAGSIPPSSIHDLVGRTLLSKIEAGDLLSRSHVDFDSLG